MGLGELGPLAGWFLGSAAGPYAAERFYERFRDRRDWSDQLLDDVAKVAGLGRPERRRLQGWLNTEDVLTALLDGDRLRLEASLTTLARDWQLTATEAAGLLDAVTGRFLQVLAPSAAVAIAEYRRAYDQQEVTEKLEAIQVALDAATAPPDLGWTFRSSYLRLVEEIPPPMLFGREAEMEQLGAFCTDVSVDRDYMWWRAEAWAGKSALMATFALKPPPGVDVVSFFITARFAGQNDRVAFLNAIADQATALLQDEATMAPPVPLPAPGILDAQVLDLLAHAARSVEGRGRRLILLVDGLDEDRGITTGPDAYSIAGLLPSRPQAGMRVIVAGRPNPPFPADVPPWHPLRDARIIRTLECSEAAETTRQAAVRELGHLLDGTDLQRAVLGLLVSACGGLTAADLAELTHHPIRRVEGVLHSVVGRTFSSRSSRFSRGPGNVGTGGAYAYLLGHEELQRTATDDLGTDLPGHRAGIDDWADGYALRRWPVQTPEYLLTGYPDMLRARASPGAQERLIRLTLDGARHDRMLDLSGGDFLALAEVAAAHQAIAQQSPPDLAMALRMGRHRNHLEDRNLNTPADLPATWALLGQYARGEALARSITAPNTRVEALSELIQVLADAGEHGHATRVAVAAEQTADAITDPSARVKALSALGQVLTATGQHQDAIRILIAAEQAAHTLSGSFALAAASSQLARARSSAGDHHHGEQRAPTIIGPPAQATALIGLIQNVIKDGGDHEHIEQTARNLADPHAQARALHELVRVLITAGNYEHAEQTARSITDLPVQAKALSGLIPAFAAAGQRQDVTRVAAAVEEVAGGITEPSRQAGVLSVLAQALAAADDYELAEQIACQITNPSRQARALSGVARVLTAAGKFQPATSFAARAEQAAHTITNPSWQARGLSVLAQALASAADYQQAERVAYKIDDPSWQVQALIGLAQALAAARQFQEARRIIAVADDAVHTITDHRAEAEALMGIVQALTETGDYRQAEQTARTITDPGFQARALSRLVQALTETGDYRQAEQTAHNITASRARAYALSGLGRALAAAGQDQDATRVAAAAEPAARAITNPYWQTQALNGLIQNLAAAGQAQVATRIAVAAEQTARTISNPAWQVRVLSGLAQALAWADRHDDATRIVVAAEQTARTIADPQARAEALCGLAKDLAAANHHQDVTRVASAAEQAARSITSPYWQTRTLSGLLQALAVAGQHQEATRIAVAAERAARSITEPDSQTRALTELVLALTAAGNHKLAEQTARTIANPDSQTRVLGELVQALIAAGDLKLAEQITRTITNPHTRAYILSELAAALNGAGLDHQARRIAALSCGLGRWWVPVNVIARLDPLALRLLTEDLLADEEEIA